MKLLKAGIHLVVGQIILVIIPINSAFARPARDFFNEMYQECVTSPSVRIDVCSPCPRPLDA